MRVALIHYWLTGMRGGERVLEAFSRMFPDADIYTHVIDRERTSAQLLQHDIKTTFISKFPLAKTHYQKYLGFMPRALEEIDLSGYDLVISSESGPAKGVVPPPDSFHMCYCHSPMRYIWDMYPDYVEDAGRLARTVFPRIAHKLRTWDTVSAARVDKFVANSSFVAKRIEKYYRRDADVVFPPVDVSKFVPGNPKNRGDYFLAAGELVGYKRFDLAIDACERAGVPLVILGGGSELKKLKARAGSNVTFLDRVDFKVLKALFQNCRALIFPGLEDFGMVPVEVMASGRPVIAYGKGGALDSVVPGVTGVLVDDQTPEAFEAALKSFRPEDYDPPAIAAHAQQFDLKVFNQKIRQIIEQQGLTLPRV